MSDEASEPDLPRAATRLALLFAAQVLGMVLLTAGAILLFVTFGHNNSLNCSSGFGAFAAGPCHHRSYALPIGLLAGGFGLFVVAMVTSAAIGMRTGASVLTSLLARRRR